MPLYDSLGENAIEYIIKHAGCSAVFVSSAKASTLTQTLGDLSSIIKTVIVWGPDAETKAKVRVDGREFGGCANTTNINDCSSCAVDHLNALPGSQGQGRRCLQLC